MKAIEQPELDLGSDVGVRPPARVLADIAHTRVPVLWMGDNVEQLFAAQPTATRSDGSRPRHPWTCRSSTTAVSAYCGRTGLSEVMNRVELRPRSRTTTLGLAIHPDGSSYPARVISGRNPEQPAGQPRGPLHDTARLLLGALLLAAQGVAYLECAGEQRDRQLRHAQLLSRKGRCRVHTLRAPTPTWFS